MIMVITITTSCNDTDEGLRNLILENKITGNPININGDPNNKRKNLPSIDSKLSKLGRDIFFTKAYSLNGDVACVSCHHPFTAGADALSLPVGVDALNPNHLGFGRVHDAHKPEHDGNLMGPRNSPTTFNVVFYDDHQFLDGKVETVNKVAGAGGVNDIVITPRMRSNAIMEVAEAIANGEFDFEKGITPDLTDTVVSESNSLTSNQVRFPITSKVEMRGFDEEFSELTFKGVWSRLQGRFRGEDDFIPDNQWLGQFRIAFNQPNGTKEKLLTEENVSIAIGEYENSQIFIENPWKKYVEGDENAISNDAKEGAKLFFKPIAQGGANCASCHTGDFFTDEEFHIIGIPQIGRGKPNPAGNNETETDDRGRFLLTLKSDDEFKWRTLSLLNVAMTGPWGHSGAYTALRNVVEHYNNPQQALDSYDFSQIDTTIDTRNMVVNTQVALDKLQKIRDSGKDDKVIPNALDLSKKEIDQLVAFLETLTDPCILDKACLKPWIPDSDSLDPDGMRLQATFMETIAQ